MSQHQNTTSPPLPPTPPIVQSSSPLPPLENATVAHTEQKKAVVDVGAEAVHSDSHYQKSVDIHELGSNSKNLDTHIPLPEKQQTGKPRVFLIDCKEEVKLPVGSTMWDQTEEEESGRERLKRHRGEVAGRVWIPEIWGQEDFLKDWIDCSAFDTSLVPNGIMSARAALAEEGRRANSGSVTVENSC